MVRNNVSYFGPRAVTLRDGLEWLIQALRLLFHHPGPFVVTALLAPVGSALLLALPIWDMLPVNGGWLSAIITVSCYGLPLTFTINLAIGLARAVSRRYPLSWPELLIPPVFQVLAKATLFLFTLLLQGCLAVYTIHQLVSPTAIMATLSGHQPSSQFTVADTILGTQLVMSGGLLLVLQLLFACFVTPLYLFRETPLYASWQLSYLAMQLNPWLGPGLGLIGLLLILLNYFNPLSVLAQLLALPLPAYLGALLYIAWREIFQGGIDETSSAPGKAEI